ncbi:MAG: glycosyltransferase [Chlorobiaceae bacterium]
MSVNSDLQALLTEQERRLYKALQEIDTKERELRSIYNTPAGKFIRLYKNYKKELKQKKNAAKNNYTLWLNQYDTLTEKRRKQVVAEISTMEAPPLISVLMPLLHTSLPVAEQSIHSLQAQLYPNWELCITGEQVPNQQLRHSIERFTTGDSRITCTFNNDNGYRSEAGNASLALASGEFFTMLDPGDMLNPLALYYIAREIAQYPQSGLLYSDEDIINEQGRRREPYFKPDFNYDLFLTHNMIGHLSVYKTSLVKQTGGFQSALEGSEDYDLALRVTENLQPQQIRHIPRILYHKRVPEASLTHTTEKSSCSHKTALLAVNNHLERKGIKATAEASQEVLECNRIRYTLSIHQPSVEIIIPTRNMAELLKICILTILAKTTYTNYSITIIDNGSTEQETLSLLSLLKKEPRIRIVRDEETPFNYSKLNNRAADASEAEYLCLMNNDIEIITPEWLNEMVSHAVQSGVGAVGARLWYPNATIQHAGVILGIKTGTGHAHKGLSKGNPGYIGRGCLQQSFSAITGACLLVSRNNYTRVNGLNERELAIGFNDIDLCLKLKENGLRNIWTPYAEMFHHESVSRGRNNTPQKRERAKNELHYMQKRWSDVIRHDPSYNPNLTIASDDFSLAWPPRITSHTD